MPNRHRAVVEDMKIVDYLLNMQHQDGRGKALFFLNLGFRSESIAVFRKALLTHAASHQVTKEVQTKFGTKYIIEGEIETPRQDKVIIRTVWMAALHTDIPKLVTAYPI